MFVRIYELIYHNNTRHLSEEGNQQQVLEKETLNIHVYFIYIYRRIKVSQYVSVHMIGVSCFSCVMLG